jgi:hypothetical protein
VTSVEELDQLLDHLTALARHEGPFSVDLSINDRSDIGAVLGRDESHLEFYSADEPPTYSASSGPWDDDTLIPFMHHGSYSELPRRYFVPADEARAALRSYFLTGRRPENIDWR